MKKDYLPMMFNSWFHCVSEFQSKRIAVTSVILAATSHPANNSWSMTTSTECHVENRLKAKPQWKKNKKAGGQSSNTWIELQKVTWFSEALGWRYSITSSSMTGSWGKLDVWFSDEVDATEEALALDRWRKDETGAERVPGSRSWLQFSIRASA